MNVIETVCFVNEYRHPVDTEVNISGIGIWNYVVLNYFEVSIGRRLFPTAKLT